MTPLERATARLWLALPFVRRSRRLGIWACAVQKEIVSKIMGPAATKRRGDRVK